MGWGKIARHVGFYKVPGKWLWISPRFFATFPRIYLSTLSQNVDPGGPPGHRIHGGSLKGPRVGKIAHLVKFLDFAYKIDVIHVEWQKTISYCKKNALTWFWGCNDTVMTSLWRHADILLFYHRNGRHTPFSPQTPHFWRIWGGNYDFCTFAAHRGFQHTFL